MPPWPGSITTSGRGSGGSTGLAAAAASGIATAALASDNGRLQLRPALGRQRLDESGAIDLFEFEHQPRRLAVGRLQHIGIGDFRRPRQIEHDSRAARHHQAIAERFDQAAARISRAGRELEADLRDIHNDPIRIGQGEGAETVIVLSRSRMKRVCLASPASRASEATGRSAAATGLGGGPSAALGPVGSAHSNAAAHNSPHPSKTR